MSTDEVVVLLLIIASVILFVLLCVIVRYHVKKENKRKIEIVEKNSVMYRSLMELNAATKFHNFRNSFYLGVTCESKTRYDRLKLQDVLKEDMMSKMSGYEYLMRLVKENRVMNDAYCDAYSNLNSAALPANIGELKIKQDKFCEIEKNLCKKNKLKAKIDLCIVCAKKYVPYGKKTLRRFEKI